MNWMNEKLRNLLQRPHSIENGIGNVTCMLLANNFPYFFARIHISNVSQNIGNAIRKLRASTNTNGFDREILLRFFARKNHRFFFRFSEKSRNQMDVWNRSENL